MVNIGLIGPSKNKLSLLRLLVKRIQEIYFKKEKDTKEKRFTIVKTYYSGEATVPGGKKDDEFNEKKTKTINPNRVIIRDQYTGNNHTFFAYGSGEVEVVEMGIITFSRISQQIFIVFDTESDIDLQLSYFSDPKFVPKEIYICSIAPNHEKLDKWSLNYSKIRTHFDDRKVYIKRFLGFIFNYDNVDSVFDQEINDETINQLLSFIALEDKIQEKYSEILKQLMESNDDINGYVIINSLGRPIVNSLFSHDKINTLCFNLSLIGFSIQNLTKQINKEINALFSFKIENNYFFLIIVDENKILSLTSKKDITSFLEKKSFLDILESIRKIPYELSTISLKDTFEKFLRENTATYKIFFSYSNLDFINYRIDLIANKMEEIYSVVKIRYYERDNKAGQEIKKYMEEGIRWSNRFVLFNSKNAKESTPVQNEIKLAKLLKKDFYIITSKEYFSTLPNQERINRIIFLEDNVENICYKLYEGIITPID